MGPKDPKTLKAASSANAWIWTIGAIMWSGFFLIHLTDPTTMLSLVCFGAAAVSNIVAAIRAWVSYRRALSFER